MTYEEMRQAGLPAKSTWNRYERGLISPEVAKVAWACEVFKVAPDLKAHMVQLASVADGPTWYESHLKDLPTMPGFTMLLEMESFATDIRIFSPLVVPGLLQSATYQRELFAVMPQLTVSAAERLGELRAARQTDVIGRARLNVILGAECLVRQVGGPEGLSEQIACLRELSSRPDVDIRILPAESGAHGGGKGEFKILRFPAGSNEPPLFYSEGYLTGQYSADPGVVAGFEERFAAIESRSVPIEEHLQ